MWQPPEALVLGGGIGGVFFFGDEQRLWLGNRLLAGHHLVRHSRVQMQCVDYAQGDGRFDRLQHGPE
jgi:hypothetical protein